MIYVNIEQLGRTRLPARTADHGNTADKRSRHGLQQGSPHAGFVTTRFRYS